MLKLGEPHKLRGEREGRKASERYPFALGAFKGGCSLGIEIKREKHEEDEEKKNRKKGERGLNHADGGLHRGRPRRGSLQPCLPLEP